MKVVEVHVSSELLASCWLIARIPLWRPTSFLEANPCFNRQILSILPSRMPLKGPSILSVAAFHCLGVTKISNALKELVEYLIHSLFFIPA